MKHRLILGLFEINLQSIQSFLRTSIGVLTSTVYCIQNCESHRNECLRVSAYGKIHGKLHRLDFESILLLPWHQQKLRLWTYGAPKHPSFHQSIVMHPYPSNAIEYRNLVYRSHLLKMLFELSSFPQSQVDKSQLDAYLLANKWPNLL